MSTPKGTVPWNAGTGKGWTDRRGYRWRYVCENGRRRQQREHRYVMEQHLGRKLEPWEVVHHRNGETSDNRIENLEVKEFGQHTTDHHSGSRRDEAMRRTMEMSALMRAELKQQREINTDLYEALKRMVHRFYRDGGTLLTAAEVVSAEAALAKAEGR